MSRSFSTHRPAPVEPRRLAFYAAFLFTGLCASCATFGGGVPDPLSQDEAVAIVNRHAESVTTLQADACDFYWRFYNGPVPAGNDLIGGIKAARGGRVNAVLREKGGGAPVVARLCSDGSRYWQETLEDKMLMTGPVNSREPRQPQWILHFRPQDLARALCIDPIETGNPEYAVSVRNEMQDVSVAEGTPENPAVRRVTVPMTVITIVSLSARQTIREIWIDREAKRIWSQSYYDSAGGVQISIRYAPNWTEIGEVEIPLDVVLFNYVGSSPEGKAARSIEIFFTDPKKVLRNETIPDETFRYTPPAGVTLKEVAEP